MRTTWYHGRIMAEEQAVWEAEEYLAECEREGDEEKIREAKRIYRRALNAYRASML